MPSDHNAHATELSRLAKLKLTPEEEATLEDNIQNILDYMDQIEEIDTSGIPTCTSVLPTVESVFGEDEPSDQYTTEMFLDNAPEQVGGMVKVPPVLEDEA